MFCNNNYSLNYQKNQQRLPQQLTLFSPKYDPPPYPLVLLEKVCSDRQSSNREVAA